MIIVCNTWLMYQTSGIQAMFSAVIFRSLSKTKKRCNLDGAIAFKSQHMDDHN